MAILSLLSMEYLSTRWIELCLMARGTTKHLRDLSFLLRRFQDGSLIDNEELQLETGLRECVALNVQSIFCPQSQREKFISGADIYHKHINIPVHCLCKPAESVGLVSIRLFSTRKSQMFAGKNAVWWWPMLQQPRLKSLGIPASLAPPPNNGSQNGNTCWIEHFYPAAGRRKGISGEARIMQKLFRIFIA